MLEAEVGRLDSSDPTWRLSKTYRLSLEILLAALPAVAIGYLLLFFNPGQRFEYHLAHEIGVALAFPICGFAAYLAWRCHAHNGEPFVHWLAVGFAGCGFVSLFHGMATRFSDHHPGLFALYGGTARLILATCLLAAVCRYGAPSESPGSKTSQRRWWASLGVIVAATALIALIPHFEDGRAIERFADVLVIVLSLISLLILSRRTLTSPLMTLYGLAVAFFAQAAFAHIISEPWSHLWWLAHAISMIGFLLLSYGVAKAFLTTRSFSKFYRQEVLVEQLVGANRQLLAALAEANQANAALSQQVALAEQSKTQVRQSERQFRDIFDHAPIGMALIGLDGHLIEANEAFCRLLGYTPAELVAMDFQAITHPADVAASLSQLQELIDGNQEVCRVEKRYLHRDGKPVWALLSICLQRDTDGKPVHLLAQIVDIGGIKAAQQALAESEIRLQRVLEGSNDGFWDRHIPSGTTTFSSRWAAMLGYDSSEIAPTMGSWEKLVHPEDLPMCRRILSEHLSGERDRYEAVYRMRHKNGHWVWILARGKAYEWDEAGAPLRMAGTHTDVTVRQLTTEALRLRERTLKAVLEALPIGVWIADANGRISSANATALAMGPGIRYRALTPDGPNEEGWGAGGRTITPHDWALAHAIERRERIRDQLVEIEFADGSKKTVLNSGLPILDEEENPLGAIAVNQDMTQWLALEQDLLRRTHQLEESNRELEQFAYVASHDLQEPLRKVSSFAQLFAKKYSGRLDDAGQTYIDFMVDGATRMQTLVDDLLHYSRLTRSDRSRQEVDMEEVLQGVLTDLQLMVREAGASIHASPMPPIQGDGSQLRALMQNLISNAVKYRAPERPPEIHAGASVRAGEATFWVRDNGIGIDPRYFERIFVIFQRLHARTEYPGTGIGLAICKKIVDNHAGRIWVESTPGQGATFFFTLPFGEARNS